MKFKNHLEITILLCLLPIIAGFSQSCDFFIEGTITDNSTNKGLPYAEVYIQETKKGAVTDGIGNYRLDKICKGTYHLVVRHLSCAAKTILIEVKDNLRLDADLEHSQSVLGHVVVNANKAETLQEQLTINERKIEDNLADNLGDLTENFTGVSSFKNGSGVSKPIIHGLYGNRVAILNNGIPLAGQQWGIDHAPEIDTQAAQKISVIKGVGGVKYPAAQLGGAVLVEASPIDKDPHLHGRANAFAELNGAATGASLQLQQFKKIGWKITATTKQSGDRKAPDYFLTNTGSKQQNLTLQLAYDIAKKWKTDLNISYFNTEIGILSGSQGNTSATLLAATRLEVPNGTEDIIGFGIGAPRQVVDHYFGKWNLSYRKSAKTTFAVMLSAQENSRAEFDIGRGNLSETPTMDINQKSYQVEGVWKQKWQNDWNTEAGLQSAYTDNTNAPANRLRIRRAIPNYTRTQNGFYTIIKSPSTRDFHAELGFRFSQDNQNIVTNKDNEGVKRFSDDYLNYTTSLGFSYQPAVTKYTLNFGYVKRSPDVNERFFDGVHLTEATIMKGDPNLKSEQAAKVTGSIDTFVNDRFTINLLGYYQYFKNYIFDEPSGDGNIGLLSFPLNVYKQTKEAFFTGVDLTLGYEFSNNWSANLKGSYLYAHDVTRDQPIIFAPANNILLGMTYNFTKSVSFLGRKWENLSLKLDQKYEFEQKRFPFIENSPTYPSPPPGFYLMNASVSAEFPFAETRLRLVLKGENLLNNSYRNYMNRLRFYADEEGFNLNLTAVLIF